MTDDTIAREYGTATLEPSGEVVAGTYGTWEVTYTVGALGMDDGAAFKLAIHQTSDWGNPQFDDPAADNYATVETSGDAAVSGTFDPDGHERPHRHAVVAKVTDGSLAPGETITITMGDTTGGSLGQRAQTFAERDVRFLALVDPHKTGDFVELPDDLSFDVVPGRARSAAAVLPSTVEPGEEATLSVRAEDFWGNVATGYSGTLAVAADGDADAPDAVDLEGGVGHAEVAFEAGVHRVTVRDRERLEATSNPCVAGGDANAYWGDIHGQSAETVGHGSVRDYFEHLSERAFVDFGSHAGNDFQITDEFWEELLATVREFHDPGEFVTFPCYEWSATTAIGGDHNVYFRGDGAELNRSSKWLVEEGFDKHEGTHPVEALYERYEGRDDVLIIPHQGGRPSTLDTLDPDLTPFVEITSVWGVFEWFAREAMETGHEVGFVGGSDDHCGRPGTAPPDDLAKHNVTGGLMAAFADDLSRESLWEAFESRRVYATTGSRILLDVDVAGAAMGESIEAAGPIDVSAAVHGTAPVEAVDLFRGTERIAAESFEDGAERIEVRWRGQRDPPRSRDKVIDWSGGARLSEGEVERAEAFGIAHPEEGIRSVGDTVVRWEAYTTGNRQGVRLDLDAPDGATLAVSTPPASASVELGDLGSVEVDADGVDAGLEIRRTGAPTEPDVEASFEDDPGPGTHPYYVRVRQADGGMAWSSPVFVTVP